MKFERCEHRLHTVIVYRILIEVEDVVGDSEFQKFDKFFCRDLADIGETGADRNCGINSLSAMGTGMLVKRALTSNETKFSSPG